MSLKNISKFKNMVYGYLRYRNTDRSEHIENLIEECFKEVEELSQFRYIYAEFDYPLDFIEKSDAYKKHLKGCSSYYLVLTTLGKRVDDKCKYYSLIDLEKMVVFDSVSNAYLEYLADEYEDEHFAKPKTFRFCPGYQKTSTADIREIFKYLDNKKIGVEIMDSNLMIPLKTMCGIVGIGNDKGRKSCDGCITNGKCDYRKVNETCYSKN